LDQPVSIAAVPGLFEEKVAELTSMWRGKSGFMHRPQNDGGLSATQSLNHESASTNQQAMPKAVPLPGWIAVGYVS